MATPTKPLKDAIAEYQAKNPYSQAAYEGLFPYLQQQGYNVARTTHAGNTLASNDALVDSNGNVYDLVFNSDNAPGAGAARWTNNPSGTYDPSRKVVGPDGTFIGYSDWAKQYQQGGSQTPPSTTTGSPGSGSTQTGGTQTGTSTYPSTVLGQGGLPSKFALPTMKKTMQDTINKINQAKYMQSVVAPATAANAASAAAMRARATAMRGGRRSTILGGFGSGAPNTRAATVLGS